MAFYTLVWTLFGLLAFMGDVVLHQIVDARPWLAARPWLIDAGIVAVAGAYQFTPLKEWSLARCRHPAAGTLRVAPVALSPIRAGLDHGFHCLGSSWALMLLMFAEGLANLWWMVGLAALMAYETSGRHGDRMMRAAGCFLVMLAGMMLVAGGAPH